MSNVNERKVTVAARVPLDLATELTRMAETGNRTVSREIWAAVAEHVANRKDFSSRGSSSASSRSPVGVAGSHGPAAPAGPPLPAGEDAA